ncbi:pericentrin isoform X2 [Misgurnus anguillicaudatus]|uniref:pericentrin isoform X2 n=1 Tax=Misgurnus anguillicaudatus TaxID=75329 RepID=UPI003CCFB9E6
MDQDEKQRKIAAGRAKLADFRQRRAKSESSGTQKKTQKRKGQTVQTNDQSAQECHLEEPHTDHHHVEISKELSEASFTHFGADGSITEIHQFSMETIEVNAQECSSSSGSEVPDQTDGALAEITEVAHGGKEQLKQLQTAVEKRNEIIYQLSTNLQVALQSRDQVQLEAQQLTSQIQALQQQLQQTKEYLRSKSLGSVDLTQTAQSHLHLQLEESQQTTKEQQRLLAQKESEITDLLQKLTVMERSLSQLAFTQRNIDQSEPTNDQHSGLDVSSVFPENSIHSNADAVLQRLRAELEEERNNTRQAQEQVDAFQERIHVMENQRMELEANLAEVQVQLKIAEAQASEAQQYKAEKDVLNQEMAKLGHLVKELQNRLQEEEEAEHNLRSKYEADISNYDLRLRALEEERELNVAQLIEAHETALKRLQEEHLQEIGRVQELLHRVQQQHDSPQQSLSEVVQINWNEISKKHSNEDHAVKKDYSFDISVSGFQDVLMERYLASDGPQESSLFEESMVDDSETSKFELDSEVIFHGSDLHIDVTCNGDTSEPGLSVVPDTEENKHGEMSFTDAHWENSTSVIEELNESADNVDLAKELLIQQCRDLSEQLEEQERQLDILKEEVKHSAEEVEEARERWSKASEELEEAKWELEVEREKRIHCEEIISQKVHEEDNLKNLLSHLRNQQHVLVQDNEQIITDNADDENSIAASVEELIKEMRAEKAQLVQKLKHQEELVKDVHIQKAAGDSVSNDVHAVFDRQLSSLQAQSDEFLTQLEEQKENNQSTSVLLGQKSMQLEQANKELQQLKAEVEEKVGKLQELEKDKTDLESKLACLKENLSNMEEEKAALERSLQALENQAKSMEKILESELKDFEHHLEAKDAELKEVKEAHEKAEEEYMEKERALQEELLAVKHNLEDCQKRHEDQQKKLEEKHNREIEELNLRSERELTELRSHLEEEQKKQISLIKQVHERENERELTQLADQQSEEIERLKDEISRELRDGLEAAHQAELLQTQSHHNLEFEALRLSLTNLHEAQLEHIQDNMQKEKEAALTELQTALREKWSQESAMLQTRQQFELERIREQSREQEERIRRLHQQEIGNLNEEWERRVLEERNSVDQLQASKLEDLKAEAEKAKIDLQGQLRNAHQRLSKTQMDLSEAQALLAETQHRLEELQRSRDEDVKNLEEELKQALADRDAAARAVEELVACHKLALHEQKDRARALEQREKELKQEVERLQSERDEQKASLEQEISNLWSQLECMRTNRQELGELKEQLLARSSRVDDIERLKQEFAQQRQEIKEQNETELENLRTYFEQRLRATEESHREEIALLQHRLLEEALEDSVLKTGDASLSEDNDERSDTMAEITQQLEKHKEELDSLRLKLEDRHQQELEHLRSTMALAYKEDLLQARTELTDRYYKDIDQLNTKHAHELEQLRAKLSDNHIKEITKLRLQSTHEVAKQVEAEVKERTQQHQVTMTQLESQLSLKHSKDLERTSEQHRERLRQMEETHQKDLEKAQTTERSLVTEEFTQKSAEEQARLKEQLQAQADERLAVQTEELRRAALEERIKLEQKLEEVQKLLDSESERLQALQMSLDCEENPQLMALKQKLQAQYDREMSTAKTAMAAEVKELNALLQDQMESKLQDALSRHLEEQKQLEEKLSHQRDAMLDQQNEKHAVEIQAQKALLDQYASQLEHLKMECQELKVHHQEELESLRTNHKKALENLEMELTKKHKVELDKLDAVFQETNLAQLEAQEAELKAQHKQEREELEERLLANMDTLENTYLKEIQAVRDEKEGELRELRALLEQRLIGEIERVRREEQTIREELRSELAKVHMDKFTAMAMELRQAHQEEMSEVLSSQRAALEDEHHSALETLQQQVIALENQHSAALLEITNIATEEKLRQQQQMDALATQHQQQLQELREVSTRELEALRRELEEQASRQRLQSQDEAELLKCQSVAQLQQKIEELKGELENEKAVAIEELEKTLKQQHEQTELAYREKMSELTAQLQQLETVVSQLRAEVSGLQVELEGKRAEMDTLETLLQRRDRENQEGDTLLAMLRADLNTATQQRQDLQTARDKLQRMLIEMLRITIATEEHVNRKLGVCVSHGRSGDETPNSRTAKTSSNPHESGDVTGVEGDPDCSVWSSAVDEGLELSQRLCESMFSGPEGEMEAEGEELMLGACTRLRTAVDKLLELVSESSQQLEQMCGLQVALDERFRDGGEARESLLLQNTQLLEQLDHEASLKSQLQLELHKAEGLMEGYVAEKAILEETLQQKETQQQRLAEELEGTRIQLEQLSENHSLLLRQREALAAGLGDTEKGFLDAEEETALLAEAERLGQECVEVQRQAEKDCGGMASRLRMLEQALEEQESQTHQLEEQHRLQTEDLQQHIDALEKQLKHNRQFIDEQAVEREHERDEFQQEIKNLEAQLRQPSKGHAGDSKGQRVESLQALIRDKMEDYSVLLAAKEQCQLDVEERNEEIEKLATHIRELEQALLSSAEASRTVTQLEQELQKARKSIQELTQDKEALQQQQYANKLQISALQSKLDETRHRFPDVTHDSNLQEQLEATQQDLQTKEQQLELLSDRVGELEKDVDVRVEEIRQLTLQLELKSRESRATEDQLHTRITQLQETVEALTRRLEEGSDDSILQLPSALLEEKNLEIDHLNQQILQLQQELDLTSDNKIIEEKQTEIDELRSLVERLRCDQERLRHAKEEEVEQLHEVINKLQEELSQLDPNHHEVSDPNTDSPESSDFPWSPHPSQQRASEESLCQELNSHTLQSSRARLKELQIELEHAAGEREALQRLLLSQEEQYGGQVEALGRSLGEEREKVTMLEQEAENLKLQLEEKRAEVERLTGRVAELEDKEQSYQTSLKESELQLKRAEEKREEVQRELSMLQEEVERQRVEKEQLESHFSKLQYEEEERQNELIALQSKHEELEEQVEAGRADIIALETGKRELFLEREALRKRERCLQEEIELMKQEVTSKTNYIAQLQEQQEETVARQGEAQKEVLTCAEETLAKAETALREREEQLIHLRAEHDALRAELAAVKEGLSTSTERAEKLREEGQTKDRALADLEVHNQHLKAELRNLQDDLAVQEEELAYQQRELEQLQQRCSLQDHHPKQDHQFLDGLSRDPSASLFSPEVLRRLEYSEEHPSRLHVSHLSELSTLRNASLEIHSKHSPMERDREMPHGRQSFVPPAETDPPSTHSPSPCSLTVSEHLSALDSIDADKVDDLENLDGTLSRSPVGSTSPVSVPEWVSDGYGSNVSSELEAMLKHELENTERLDAHFVEYLRCRGISPADVTDSAAGSMHESHERLAPELQAMLKRVYQESCRILSLSHRPTPSGQSRPDSEPAPPPSWQRERRALQETILSLRELLCRMADREPIPDSGDVDWKRELLQAVRSVFDSEREWLHLELQAVMTTMTQIDHTPLLDQLHKLFQKQEEQQRRSLEQLFSADRHSLLAEVRSLHEQLHASTQHSQEQLQKLQDSLHSAKEQGTQTQHQLHIEIEDLEMQLQKERMMSHELRSSLEAEKSRAVEQLRQLEAELKTFSELKAELEETRQQLQSASINQEELKSQINKLWMKLESVEAERQACLKAVEKEQIRVQELQEELQQQRLNDQQTIERNHQTQESLRLTLNEQASQLSQLNSALNQEHVTVSNLRSELQIEQSRCEALIAQERERTELAISRLEEERSRSSELSDTLSRQAQEHARRLEEEARRQEAASAHDRKFIQDLRMQLEQERRQGEDLAAMLERLQGQVLEGKRRQAEEAEQEARKEQEDATRLRTALEGLQAQKTEVGRTLEVERERARRLQTELDGMKEKMKAVKERERVREEQMERQRRKEKQEQVEQERRHEHTNEKLLQLELLRQKDQQRLKQLQQTVADLEQEEKRLTSERLKRDTLQSNTHTNTQDSTSSTSSLIERLLKENSEFSECLAALSEEKISLKHTISCLEKELQNLKRFEQERSTAHTEQCVVTEKMAWQKEKAALQTALRKAEADLSRITAGNENRPVLDLSNSKIQRLYERYLRAESYRKSLVYQKRYLLLLLGGFQDCEQATLALIARMGAQPSLSQTQVSKPLNRFRTSVRVVIAISRLKFLTRKWQKATRKVSIGTTTVNGHGARQSTAPVLRTEVLKPQQTAAAFKSPPTRDHAFTQRGVVSSLVPPIKSPFRLNNRMYPGPVLGPADRSFGSSQDQERSLTEYIQHLENVQQRLGAVCPGAPSALPYSRKSDR